MRRTLFALAGLALLLATACSSRPYQTADGKYVHRQRHTEAELVVNFRVYPSASIVAPWVQQNASEWSAARNVRATAGLGSCSGVANCVAIYGEPRNGGVARIGWDSAGHITGSWIWFDNTAGQQAINLDNGTCHEMGHALGLRHGDEPGPCQLGHPTKQDLDLLGALHGDHLD